MRDTDKGSARNSASIPRHLLILIGSPQNRDSGGTPDDAPNTSSRDRLEGLRAAAWRRKLPPV